MAPFVAYINYVFTFIFLTLISHLIYNISTCNFLSVVIIKGLLERGVSHISDLGPSEKSGNFLLFFFNVNYYIS